MGQGVLGHMMQLKPSTIRFPPSPWEIEKSKHTPEVEKGRLALTVMPSQAVRIVSIGQVFTGGEAPVSGNYRCEICERQGKTTDIPLAIKNNFPPCGACNGKQWRLIRLV